MNVQESTTILNACTKTVWKLIEYITYVMEIKHYTNKRTDNGNNEKNSKNHLRRQSMIKLNRNTLVFPYQLCVKFAFNLNKTK